MPGKREGNRKDRRLAPQDAVDRATMERLLRQLRYEGIALHKLHPGNYGFVPPVNPRAEKSACDGKKPLNRAEAQGLLEAGIRCGMVSAFVEGGAPKYIWSVDEHGEVYEAKCDPQRAADNPDEPVEYHGYPLEDGDLMRKHLVREWRKRQP